MSKKSDILKAAALLFAQYSLKKVTMDEIAEKASVSKATIYKYYESKEEVFDQVVKSESVLLWDAINRAVDEAPTVVEKLRVYLLTKLTNIHDLVNFYRVTHETLTEYWPYVESARAEFITREKELVESILKEGSQAGELYVDKIDLTAHTIVISLKSMEFTWAIATFEIPLEEYVNFLIDLIVNGIGRKKIND